MRLLTAVDQLFLLLETRRQPMHVGGLFVFKLPNNAPADFVVQLAKQMTNGDIPPSFPFNQMLSKLLFWKTDENFEVEHHFRHISLPKPAGMDELLNYVSKEHSNLLSRDKPMWECHLIEGIADERFALYFKIHHSMVDGIAAMRLVKKSLAQSPDEQFSLPAWALMTRHRQQVDAIIMDDKPWLDVLKRQLKSVFPVGRELVNNLHERFRVGYVTTTQAPDSLFNQPISSHRKLAAQSYDLARFRQVSDKYNATLNDVILAVCAGALRRYLLAKNALPEKPLIGFVPISLRKDDSSTGNQLSFILANLATSEADPLQRLQKIQSTTQNGKKRFGRMSQAAIINYSALVYSRAALQIVTGWFPEYRGFNVVISNVPGSRQPLYWQGARLEALYPVSVVFNDQALNITLCSYDTQLEVCLTACSQIVPEVERILGYLEDELKVYENL